MQLRCLAACAVLHDTPHTHTHTPPQTYVHGCCCCGCGGVAVFINFADICRTLHREPEHVLAFMLAEMGTTGSLDGSNRLVVRGRFVPKAIEGLIRRYISEYVTCQLCKSPETLLTKENRLYFVKCTLCGATRTVSTVTRGYRAQVGRRKR